MSLIRIAYKSIRQRALASSLTALSVALGVMLMVAVLVIYGIVERVFSQRSIGYDLIVGPKGSDLDLVLSTVYRIRPPIENLPYKYYLELKEHPLVDEAVPFALGDVTRQGAFPIVGTTSRYFQIPYAPNERFLIRGEGFGRSFDAIIGSEVARKNGWDTGTQFSLVHGGADSQHVHDEKFTVVGVLKKTGTPNDKTVFVHLNGFFEVAGHEKPIEEAIERWREFKAGDVDEQEIEQALAAAKQAEQQSDGGHHHHQVPDLQKEVTAILLRMKSPTAAVLFAGKLKSGYQAQAVNPIQAMSDLMKGVVGNVQIVLLVLTGLIIAVSGIGIFVSIYNSMADRKKEIAIMRALGAQRTTVFAIILAESVLLCVGGGVMGLLLGHGLVFLAAPVVAARSGLLIDPLAFEPVELVLFPALIGLASLVGFVPGMTAYRTDVAKALSD